MMTKKMTRSMKKKPHGIKETPQEYLNFFLSNLRTNQVFEKNVIYHTIILIILTETKNRSADKNLSS